MKKLLLLLGLLCLTPQALWAATSRPDPFPNFKPEVKVQFPEGMEVIRSFDVQAELTADRTLKITEDIEYDFGDQEKHGIYRFIPETYTRDGMAYSLKYEVGQVLRDGESEPYSEYRENDNLVLKIGRSDVTMLGKHKYVIVYTTKQAVNFFPDGHSELYWNATGNQWPVPIAHASFFLKSPLGEATSTLRFICYTGSYGSTEQACSLNPQDGGYAVTADRSLNEYEGLTVVFGFPQGTITPETWQEALLRTLRDNWILICPLLALAVMFYIWSTKGKDPTPETVIPQYESPRDMSPLVLSAALGSGTIPMRGVTATLIQMARENRLHIKYEKTKILFIEKNSYTFLKRQEPTSTSQPWEKILWDGLFKSGTRDEVKMDDLQEDKFYIDVQNAVKEGTKALQALNIFVANPYLVRALYVAAAIVVFLVVRVAGGDYLLSGIVAFVTALIVAIFGWFMPKRTKDGTSIVAEVKGFKWFLSVTEEERLKFHNAPARTPEQFMEMLPYAIALGVEKEWAKQFEDMQLPPPDWAEGDMHAFSTVALASAMSDLNTQGSSAAFSPPSSSGSGGSGFSGGGSGGGGGGGGGGSW